MDPMGYGKKKQKIYTACTFGTFFEIFANVYNFFWAQKRAPVHHFFFQHGARIPVAEHTRVIGETFANNANVSNMIALSTGFHFKGRHFALQQDCHMQATVRLKWPFGQLAVSEMGETSAAWTACTVPASRCRFPFLHPESSACSLLPPAKNANTP